MSINLTDFIRVFVVIQCVLFSSYLFTTSNRKSLRNRLLGAFLVVLGFQMGLLSFELRSNVFIYRLILSLRFVFGPMLYFYVKSMTEKEFEFNRKQFIHFIPFVVIFTVFNLNIILSRPFLVITMNASALGYLVASFVSIQKYQEAIRITQSMGSSISLTWLMQLIAFIGVVLVLNFVNNVFYHEPHWPGPFLSLVEMVILFLMVNTMVLKGLRHPTLFTGVSKEDLEIVKEVNQKYASSALSDADVLDYSEKLEQLMNDKKPYINPELTLAELADMINITNRELSQVINTQFNKNFSEYVNHYRIKEALHIFDNSDDSKMTVLEVMYEVGFNSRSSFYNAFKKVTNMTPKEYRAQEKVA